MVEVFKIEEAGVVAAGVVPPTLSFLLMIFGSRKSSGRDYFA